MLPKLDVPIYDLTLPSNQKKIKFRPYLVKEEKLLLMALEASDSEVMLNTVKQIINNCVIDKIDVDDIPIFDLEYFMLNLRARSAGESLELQYVCKNNIDTKTCNNLMQFNVDLLGIQLEKNINHNPKITLTKNIGVMMKYPKLSLMEIFKNMDSNNPVSATFDFITNNIEYVYENENIFYAKDNMKDMSAFVENLSSEHFKKIEQFFDTIPKLKTTIDNKCIKCGFEHKIVLEGLQSFFG